jgi:hypothetical protein
MRKMYYMHVIIDNHGETDYLDGYVLSDGEPDVDAWAAERMSEDLIVLESKASECPVINYGLVHDPSRWC